MCFLLQTTVGRETKLHPNTDIEFILLRQLNYMSWPFHFYSEWKINPDKATLHRYIDRAISRDINNLMQEKWYSDQNNQTGKHGTRNVNFQEYTSTRNNRKTSSDSLDNQQQCQMSCPQIRMNAVEPYITNHKLTIYMAGVKTNSSICQNQ